MTEHIAVTTDGAVRRIRFNRPDKKNALIGEMYSALADAMSAANADPAIRVLLLEGTDGVFTAGNDMHDFLAINQSDAPPANLVEFPVGRFLMALAQCDKPLIAAVEGPAIGIGLTMLLHCDLVFAGRSAKIQAPFVNLGVLPEAGASVLLPGLCGHQRAFEILAMGRALNGEEAAAWGLANHAVDDGTAADAAMEAARALCAKAPDALLLTKRLMKGDRAKLEAIIREEGAHFHDRLRSDEVKEIVTAFLEKRAPRFDAA